MRRRRARVCSAAAASYTSSRPSRGRAIRSSSGSRTEASTTRWCRTRIGSTGSSPSSTADGSSGREQDDERPLPARSTAPRRPARSSRPRRSRAAARRTRPRAGCVASRAPARRSRARTRRSPATTSTRSPARAASAVSSSAASIAESRRGTSADPAGRGARGVEHQDDAPVALGLPGAHHDGAVAGAWPASRWSGRRRRGRTRAASRTRCPGRAPGRRTGRRARGAGRAALGRCLRDSNGGSDRTAAGHVAGASAAPRARAVPRVRSVTPDGAQVAAPASGAARWSRSARSPGGEPEPVPVAGRAGRRLPGVADQHRVPARRRRCRRPAALTRTS